MADAVHPYVPAATCRCASGRKAARRVARTAEAGARGRARVSPPLAPQPLDQPPAALLRRVQGDALAATAHGERGGGLLGDRQVSYFDGPAGRSTRELERGGVEKRKGGGGQRQSASPPKLWARVGGSTSSQAAGRLTARSRAPRAARCALEPGDAPADETARGGAAAGRAGRPGSAPRRAAVHMAGTRRARRRSSLRCSRHSPPVRRTRS